MIKRQISDKLSQMATKLPVIAILGPRQSGKTTLAKSLFKNHKYISFEDIDQRLFATSDPRKFLSDYANDYGIILDEVQHVPTILSYIQTKVDEDDKPGYFILTGSQNLLVNQAITQTLAGRIAVFTLLPLSIAELRENNILPSSLDTTITNGGYPRIFAKNILPQDWYPHYIQMYIERDVRQIINIIDLLSFQRFIKLCAGRIGQILNLSSLATDCGISSNTAKAWLSVLEASYIVFLLQPYYKNFSKRLIKAPKLYFFDSGIACTLLNIESEQQLATHYLRGGIFESLVIAELFKKYYNIGKIPNIYFWRDIHGHEVDCIIEQADKLYPIEIKAGQTITQDYFSGLEYWNEITSNSSENSYVVYGGSENQHRTKGTIVNWKSIDSIPKK